MQQDLLSAYLVKFVEDGKNLTLIEAEKLWSSLELAKRGGEDKVIQAIQ
ncbi:MAG: hypothetical protein AB4426_11885 [Xenococcaceae cyanobacterium]